MEIFKTMEKSEFCVLIKHYFLMGKKKLQLQQSNGLINVSWNLTWHVSWAEKRQNTMFKGYIILVYCFLAAMVFIVLWHLFTILNEILAHRRCSHTLQSFRKLMKLQQGVVFSVKISIVGPHLWTIASRSWVTVVKSWYQMVCYIKNWKGQQLKKIRKCPLL